MLTDKEQNKIIEDIYAGQYSIFDLPEILYLDIFNDLMGGISEGWGKFSLEGPAFETASLLKNNIHIFSGAKDWRTVYDIQSKIFDEEGFKRSFNEFKKDAKEIYSIYNETWLEAAFQPSIGQSREAKHWLEIEKDAEVLPMLRYITVGDERVRHEHAALDGIVKPVTDSFWNTFMPSNGFRCRCTVEQLTREEAKETNISKEKLKELHDGVPTLFRMNPGKDKYVFKETGKGQHPYFNPSGLPPKIKEVFELQKKNEFGFTQPKYKNLP